MRVCVVGSGGREHALALALARTATVVVTPGNPGISWAVAAGGSRSPGVAAGGSRSPGVGPAGFGPAGFGAGVVGSAGVGLAGPKGRITCRDTRPEDVDADLWVIGPEVPLVDGLADRLRSGGRLVFGPGADGAQLEGSKAWMKGLLAEAGVPTAAYGVFTDTAEDADAAVRLLRRSPGPWVIKTDGLAAGKGVLVTESLDEAIADVVAKLSGATFGAAGRRIVIEEGLRGPELSVMALCDGTRAVPLAAAQDFKRIGDGDVGANTGGMGAYSPVPAATEAIVGQVMNIAVEPTLAALRARGIDYRGVLYAGIMLTADGPKVLEFNVRFGDPETQVVLPRWRGDVAAVLAAAAAGRLDRVSPPAFGSDAAVCVVLASEGYPEHPRTGDRIEGITEAVGLEGVQVYAAGVGRYAADPAADPAAGRAADPAAGRADPAGGPGGLVTAGGRVLGVTGLGPTLALARERAYEAVAKISWPGMLYRRDIAVAAIEEGARL